MSDNGNTQTIEQEPVKLFGIPCKGCTDRKQIMSAGNWQIDAMIIGGVTLLIIGYLVLKWQGKE
jgi:hypothetical protein